MAAPAVTGSAFGPRGECRNSNCDGCQSFYQTAQGPVGICSCGHGHNFHAFLPAGVLSNPPTDNPPPNNVSPFRAAPNFERFELARDRYIQPTTATPEATPDRPYMQHLPGPTLLAPVHEFTTSPIRSPTRSTTGIPGLPSGNVVSDQFRARRISEMRGRGTYRRAGRARNSPVASARRRYWKATFTYLRQPFEPTIPNGMSTESKRLDSRGLCNIEVNFDEDSDSTTNGVRRVITAALAARGLGRWAEEWKLWKHPGGGQSKLGALGRNVVQDLVTLKWCCRANHKRNFYITPISDLLTLKDLYQMRPYYDPSYSRYGGAESIWEGWEADDEFERGEFQDSQTNSSTIEEDEVELESNERSRPSTRRRRTRSPTISDDGEYTPSCEQRGNSNRSSLDSYRRGRATQGQRGVGRPRAHPPGPTIRDSPPPLANDTLPGFAAGITTLDTSELSTCAPPSTARGPPLTGFGEPTPPNRRSQLATPTSQSSRFQRVISQMLESYGPTPHVFIREEDRFDWRFDDGDSNHDWIRQLFDLIEVTPWELRVTNPRPRVTVDHRDYRQGADCGGVFRSFLHQVMIRFLESEDFVDGSPFGRTFREDLVMPRGVNIPGLEPPPPNLHNYEMFGKLLASYVFCHQDFSWPRGLDPVVFIVAYKRYQGKRYIPDSSRVGGSIGNAMRVLDGYMENGPAAGAHLPQILQDVLESFGWRIQSVEQALQSPDGINAVRSSLYWETQWGGRLQALDAFVRGLNERNLFQKMQEDRTLRLEDIDSWLLQSGIPNSESLNEVLRFKHDVKDGLDLGFRCRCQRVQTLFEEWVQWSSATNPDNLDWLVQEILGTSFVSYREITICITDKVEGGAGEGLLKFSTCLLEMTLSVKLLDEYGTTSSFIELMDMYRAASMFGPEFSIS